MIANGQRPATRTEASDTVAFLAKSIHELERSAQHIEKNASKFAAMGQSDYGEKDRVLLEVLSRDPEFLQMVELFRQKIERELLSLRDRHGEATTYYNEMVSAGSHQARVVE